MEDFQMKYYLKSLDGLFYIDPFTNERAIFSDSKTAQMTAFMLFDQQKREFEVVEN